MNGNFTGCQALECLEVAMVKEISPQEARQGKPIGVMRWVLGFGLTGAILALTLAGIVIGLTW